MTNEKKFCPNCGKQLKKGEVCNCKKDSNVSNDDIATTFKGLYEDLINMIKKPATTLKDKMKNPDNKASLIILALISVAAGLFVLAFIHYLLVSTLGKSAPSFKDIDFPTLKVFIYALLISFGSSFVPVLVSLGTAKIVKNDKFDFKKSLTLYAYSYSPLFLVLLVISLFLLININILTIIVLIGAIIVCLASSINYIKGYLDEVEISADKMVYTIAIMIVATGLITGVVSSYISNEMTKDINISSKSVSKLLK